MKKFFKKNNVLTLILSLTVISVSTYAVVSKKYSPGETLNPTCLPGEANCTVNVEEVGKVKPGYNDKEDSVFPVGNVGIGTDMPGTALDINKKLPNIYLEDSDSVGPAAQGYISFYDKNGDRNGYIGDANSSDSNVYLNSDHGNVIINPFGGNVGIGTSSPGSKLDVNGIIVFKGLRAKTGTELKCPDGKFLVGFNSSGLICKTNQDLENAGWNNANYTFTSSNHSDNSEECGNKITLNCSEIKVDWQVSSELNYDFIRIYIDDAPELEMSGEHNRKIDIYDIGYSGNHTIRACYKKDGSVSRGEDRGIVYALYYK